MNEDEGVVGAVVSAVVVEYDGVDNGTQDVELDKEEDEGEKSKVEIVEGTECVGMGEGPGIRWVSVECSADDGVVVEEGRKV